MSVELDKRINIRDGVGGVVRYCGPVKGKPGIWVGIELDECRGKNDGSYQNERYFSCAPGYGLFIRLRPKGESAPRMNRIEPDEASYDKPLDGSGAGGDWSLFGASRGNAAGDWAISGREADGTAEKDAANRRLLEERALLLSQVEYYKGLLSRLMERIKSGIGAVKCEIINVKERLGRISRQPVPSSEHDQVLRLVQTICGLCKRGNEAEARPHFQKFKSIMEKHGISVG